MTRLRAWYADRREVSLAALGLLFLYLAIMNGHLMSVDGLVMWRQALSIAQHDSLALVPPIWWGGYGQMSTRGIAASLQYVPGVFAFSPLFHAYQPSGLPAYDFGLLYQDRLYTVGGAPIWTIVTAATALLVGLTTRALGFQRSAALWAVAFYGLGSPALLGARGDFPQPLVALCWAAGVMAAIQIRNGGSSNWIWLCAATIVYGVLARPLEGTFLLPTILFLLLRGWRVWPGRLLIPLIAWLGAVVVTLLVNEARFGSPLNFGYPPVSWTVPIWVAFPYAFLSPGRGVLWQFPAMLLAVPGFAIARQRGKLPEALVLAGLPAFLFVESSTYYAWIGGWDWGFRLFQPAVPLVAVLAGIGTVQLRGRTAVLLPAVLLAGGVLWNVPAVLTDLLAGYAAKYDNLASWSNLDAYPPIGAWQFLHHIRPAGPNDSASVDIVWFRLARRTQWLSLIPFVGLLGAAFVLWMRAVRFVRVGLGREISVG